MRSHRWVLALVILVLIAAVVPAHARPLPNNIIVVDPNEDPPPNLLTGEEVERIALLKHAALPLPMSPVSPNDESVLLMSDDEIAFLDLADGAIRSVDPAYFDRYIPLPLLGFSKFSWMNNDTLGALALDMGANSFDDALVRLYIHRQSTAMWSEPVRIRSDVELISVAPDLRQMLVLLPPEDQAGGNGDQFRSLRVRVTLPTVGGASHEPRVVPNRLQAAVARARSHPFMQRIWGWQEGEDETVAATARQYDIALVRDGDPQARYLTSVPAISVLFGDAWSDNSRSLAVSIFGLADTEDPRPSFDGARLSDEVYRDATGNLPPALNSILQNNNTYIVDTASATTQILRPEAGAAPPILNAMAWSPGGEHLLVSAWYPGRVRGRTHPIYFPQFSERAALRVYNRELRLLNQLDHNLFSGPAFANIAGEMVSPDEVIFRASGINRHAYYWNRVSGELRAIGQQAGSYYNVFAAKRTRQIVYAFNSFTTPTDVYRIGWDGRGATRLTWLNEELREMANLREDAVSFRLPNGATRQGVLIQPATAPFPPRDTRIIVWQQGGPGGSMHNEWSTYVEQPYALLPGMGFALLVTPVAGRPGYTPAAFNSLVDGTNFGAIDIDEQAAIAREMIRRGWTSPAKLGITGCSYGGYFTLQSVIRHPDLYAAANPQCALVDVISEWTRGYSALAPYMMGLPPYAITEEYRRDSPVYNANRIRAAVLTFHGTQDFLPIVLNENLHLQLNNLGVPARMVRFVQEGHGLMDMDNQIYAAQEQVRWFRLHLR
ncbi:MAG: S9 family peptidase [Candidatus Viridilinea halotolerans]|uniref:S9 family peptidase n=1 Tax=Candidatus Viridilinea halotolerans TaxID=2491704 RepID=A0A426TYP6_9CHLR|nr:MAG: S9 family peptidase [Candidatus Viridilinea halotolerans]